MIDTAAEAAGSARMFGMYLSQFGQPAVSGAMIVTAEPYFDMKVGPMN